jgi:hypothetical protein
MSASASCSAVIPDGPLESVEIPRPFIARLSPKPLGLLTGRGGGRPRSLSESDASFFAADDI